MSSMHTLNTMDTEAMERARYAAHMQQRTMPPRCNPISIVVLVMAIGMVFIGLSMTVIAHWPGNSSIGENPLKIAGPILLAIGLATFVVGMILVCFWQSREREVWQKNMQQAAMNRSQMMQAASMRSQPDNQRSILKTPSMSTYGRGSEYGGSDAGMGNNYNGQPGGQTGYGDPANTYSGHEVYKIDTVEESKQGRPPFTSGPIEQSSIDYGQNVPVPVRQTKPKKPKNPNQSYSSQNDDAVSPSDRNMRSYSTEGYDMYESQAQGAPVPTERKKRHRKKTEEEGDEQPRVHRHRKEKTHTNTAYESDGVSPKQPGYYSNVPATTSSYYSDANSSTTYSGAGLTSPTVYSGEGLTSPMAGAGGMGLAGAGGLGLAGSGGMGLAGMGSMGATPGSEQQLKINIRAQPNTAVHITPKMYHTPPTQQQPYSRQLAASTASVETEI